MSGRMMALKILRDTNLGQIAKLINESQIRFYSRQHRITRVPIRVNYPTGVNPETSEEYINNRTEKVNANVSKLGADIEEKQLNTNEYTKETPNVIDHWKLYRNIQYERLKDDDPKFKNLIGHTKSRKFRERFGLFLVEGSRITAEALASGYTPQGIFFSKPENLPHLLPGRKITDKSDVRTLSSLPLYRASYKILQTWSTLTTCPGVMGVFNIPEELDNSNSSSRSSLPVTVILDEVREPGNLGGILRTLAAVGVNQVILIKGCCDPWESKVLRAGCGAHFKMNLQKNVTWDSITNYVPEAANVFMADISDNVSLDIEENTENVDKHDSSKIQSVYFADEEDEFYEVDSKGQKFVRNLSYNNMEHLQQLNSIPVPSKCYNEVDFVSTVQPGLLDGIVLVIGSETGISPSAKKFTLTNGGVKVSIPLANGMDSLNTGVATGVILYEIVRQFQMSTRQTVDVKEVATNL